jgi:hypothetical protein
MKGLFAWVGFRQSRVVYDRDPRFAGETKWNYWRLWNLAVEGITSFTIAPLKLATYLGLVTALVAFIYGTVVIGRTLMWGRDLPGYASLIVVVLFLSGVQLIALGVIGEYVGRIFVETKGRPLYLVSDLLVSRDSQHPFASEVLAQDTALNFRLKHTATAIREEDVSRTVAANITSQPNAMNAVEDIHSRATGS